MTKILIDEEVVKQALDFMERHSNKWNGDGEHPMNTVTALRSALQAEKVEPVAEMTRGWPYPSDEELLDLAAKAAGIEYDSEQDACAVYYVPYLTRYYNWNPLTDDGDALRLAVKLGMQLTIDLEPSASSGAATEHWSGYAFMECHNNDPYAATRRAIVRAAAEIGKGMK